MNFARALRALLLVNALLGLAAFAQADASSPVVLAAVPLALVGWAFGVRTARIPATRFIVAGAMVLMVLFAATLIRGGGARPQVIGELAALLLGVKMFDRRSVRDDAQVLAVSVFLVLASVLTSGSAALAPILVLSVPAVCAGVMLCQIEAARERVRREGDRLVPGASTPPWIDAPRAPVRRHLACLVAAVSIALMAGAALIFIVIPRGIGADPLGRFSALGLGTATAFVDRVSLGRGGLVSQSSTPVLDLEVHKPARPSGPRPGEDLPPLRYGDAGAAFYLRGVVLDRYAHGEWTSESSHASLGDNIPGVPIHLGGGIGVSIEQEITIRNSAGRQAPIFAVWRPVMVRIKQGGEIAADYSRMTLVRKGPGGRVQYTVRSVIGEQDLPTPMRREPAGLDPGLPAVAEIARRVLAEAGIEPDPAVRPTNDDARAALVIENFLNESFEYTLDLTPSPPGRDPIEWFLTDSRRGNCEYFAAAMTALCRAVGIRARLVAGYLATEFNPLSGHFIVRQRDAHAWVEVQTSHQRWMTFDPTPRIDIIREQESEPGLLDSVQQILQAAQYYWASSIVGFDESSRQDLFGWTRRSDIGTIEHVEQWRRRVRDGGVPLLLRAARNAAAAFFAAALLVAVLPFAVRFLRRAAALLPGRRRWRANPRPELDRLAASILRSLRRAGRDKPRWQPLLTFAQSIAEDDSLLGAAALRFARRAGAARFGGRPLGPDDWAALRADAAAVARVARAARRAHTS